MPVVGAAVIPPVLHPGPLRADVDEALAGVPPFDVAVLLASGSEPLLHDVPAAEARVAGGPDRRAGIDVDTDLLIAIVRRGQAPRVQSAVVDGTLGALGLLVGAHRPAARVVPMTIPARATADALEGIAVGIAAAIHAVGRTVLIVAPGELAGAHEAATAGGATASVAGDPSVAEVAAHADTPSGIARLAPPLVDDTAGQWDGLATEAIAGSDHAGFGTLGPAAARRVGATGWAPLHALLALCAANGLRIGRSTYSRIGDTGRIVAVTAPADDEGDPR